MYANELLLPRCGSAHAGAELPRVRSWSTSSRGPPHSERVRAARCTTRSHSRCVFQHPVCASCLATSGPYSRRPRERRACSEGPPFPNPGGARGQAVRHLANTGGPVFPGEPMYRAISLRATPRAHPSLGRPVCVSVREGGRRVCVWRGCVREWRGRVWRAGVCVRGCGCARRPSGVRVRMCLCVRVASASGCVCGRVRVCVSCVGGGASHSRLLLRGVTAAAGPRADFQRMPSSRTVHPMSLLGGPPKLKPEFA